MKLHLAENVEETLMSPPRIQEMKTIQEENTKDVESASSSSSYSSSTRQESEDSKNTELQVVESWVFHIEK